MKIAFVTETWLPSTDGVVTRLLATVEQLRELGHEVLVIAPQGDRDATPVTVRDVPTISAPFVYGGQPWGLPVPRVKRYLREFRPDVVHVVNPIMLGIAGVTAAVRLDIPLVTSYHTNVANYAGYYHLGWLSRVITWVEQTLHGRAAVNLATSAATCEELERRGIPGVRLWRRGVDLRLFHPDRRHEESTSEPGEEDEPTSRTALYVGRLAQEKSLHRLESLARARDVSLVLVGDGPARDSLTAALASPSVAFAGMQHGETLANTYAAADVFVFPSTNETLGLVLLEAMASGLPVIAAETPVSREILGDCPAVRLFPPDRPDLIPELIEELLGGLSRSELAKAARNEAENWSWYAATRQLLEYYETAIDTHTTP